MNEDKAARYQRLKRRARLLSAAGGAVFLLILAGTGLSIRLRDAAATLSSGDASSSRTVAVYALFCASMVVAATCPLAAYRTYVLDRRFGLSSEPLRAWFADYVKGSVFFVVVAVAAAQVISLSIRISPELWWLAAAGVFGGTLVAASRFGAVALIRLFHRVEPLDRPALRNRLLRLAARAGVPATDVLVVHLGRRTSRASAALVGFGRARRIVVSDTLLDHFPDTEIEVVLAHEMGHHANHDVPRILALELALMISALAAGAALLNVGWQPLGLTGPADTAGLPLIVIGGLMVSVIARPALNAFSRRVERRADRYALALTGRPAAFISTMRRFAARNLAEERPSRLTRWLFHTHPSFAERIRAAEAFQPGGRLGTANR